VRSLRAYLRIASIDGGAGEAQVGRHIAQAVERTT
jgi:hypothetical protein